MDIKNPKLLKLKGVLFLLLSLFSGGLLICFSPDWVTVVLLLIAVWAACRFYYFAFYVLHHYADSNFKYSGLWDLMRYLLGKRGK